ncbi:hypothetical protein E2C01_061571 [Portunus trituberculatus]|uniref:Uncharacterized protein n=1 Tax=Portunus trituberculatus TaxID=210409 RepID=A0A5B7HBM1_PORTR|nr:hypothetical protein [Portunus trituberculatus]
MALSLASPHPTCSSERRGRGTTARNAERRDTFPIHHCDEAGEPLGVQTAEAATPRHVVPRPCFTR